MGWRDKLALRSRRQADYAWTVLARVLSCAKDRGIVAVNPCERGGRLYRGSSADKIWTDDDEATFYRIAPAHLHLPLLIALWTGQRQGDLLRLTWHAFDGKCIRLKQSKTGARVVIPVGAPLKQVLDATKPRGERMLLNSDEGPGRPTGFDRPLVRRGSPPASSALPSTICGALPSLDSRSQNALRLRSPRSPDIRCVMFARSFMRTTFIVIRRSVKAPSVSSKGERQFPTKPRLCQFVPSANRRKCRKFKWLGDLDSNQD